MEYEVIWGDGPLGLTLRPDLGEDMPPVVGRITKRDSTAASARVAVGHMLVSVNGQDTARKGYDHTVEMLQTVSKPARLRFRVPLTSSRPRRERRSLKRQSSTSSSLKDREDYNIIWTEGPLGIILRPDDDDYHIPSIRKVTGKGTGSGIDQAGIGDLLVGVNGQDTKSIGFRATISLLRTIQKPAVLKFRPSKRQESTRPSTSSVLSSRSDTSSNDFGIYDIIWKEGQPGFTLKPDPDSDRETPIISRLTGRGNSSGLHNAVVGDELISVNGESVESETYQEVLRVLKNATKPATLRFRPGAWSKDIKRTSVASVHSHASLPDSVRSDSSSRVVHYKAAPPQLRSSHEVDNSSIQRQVSTGARGVGSRGSGSQQETIVHFNLGKPANDTQAAQLLKLQARAFIMAQEETEKRALEKDEALAQAHSEALALAQALEQVKLQAKEYEKLLAAQNAKDMIIANAVGDKPADVIGKQKSLLMELNKKLPDISFDEAKIEEQIALNKKKKPPPKQGERWNVINELHSVLGLPALGEERTCADCFVPESEAELEPDDDGQYYCMKCWEKFYGLTADLEAAEASLNDIGDDSALQEKTSSVSSNAPANVEADRSSIRSSLCVRDSMVRRSRSVATPKMILQKRQKNKQDVEKLMQEEANARLEAEAKLRELQEMRLHGEVKVDNSSRGSMKDKQSREERQRRGNEELARALEEEAARARAKGNEDLARKLAAQAKREDEIVDKKRFSNDELSKAMAVEEARLLKLETATQISNVSDPVSPPSRPSTTGEDDDEDDDQDEDARTEALFAQVERARALAQEAATARQEAEEESRILAAEEKLARARVLVDYAIIEKEKEEDRARIKAEEEAWEIAQAKYKAETDAWQLEAAKALAEAEEAARLQLQKESLEAEVMMEQKGKEIEQTIQAEQEAKWRQNEAYQIEFEERAREEAKMVAQKRIELLAGQQEQEILKQVEAAEQARVKAAVDEDYLVRARAELESFDRSTIGEPDADTIAHVRAELDKLDNSDGYYDEDERGNLKLEAAEARNFKLAKQLEEAHEVVSRVRESSILNGHLAPDSPVGLSVEQINLFKRLTTEAEERASIVNRFHPQDDSDSDDSLDMDNDDPDGVWI